MIDHLMSFNFGMVSPINTFKAEGLTRENSMKINSKLTQHIDKSGLDSAPEINISNVKTGIIKNNRLIRGELLNKTFIDKDSGHNYYKHHEVKMTDQSEQRRYFRDGFSSWKHEDPFKINPWALSSMNNFKYQYQNPVPIVLELGKKMDGGQVIPLVTKQEVAMSLFNPMYMVNVKGISANVPLLNNKNSPVFTQSHFGFNTSDCSIAELVRLSRQENSILGNARYRYVDFMYCKDLGKMSNNHLITLRVFPYPIGDHIFELASPAYYSKRYTFTNTGDIGRLVTWFGTEDNKLEDILTYEYNATWKELGADIEQINSRENDAARGPLGLFINTFTPSYNESVNGGYAGDHSMWKYIGADTAKWDSGEILTNYDRNKVYTPVDTVQKTNIYEGKLEFSHQFTLNFCYKLRAYDNINPKSAFLDLMGNILAVTYRRGHFWGGDRKWIGPPQNQSAWAMANSIIENKFDEVGGIFQSMVDNGFSLASLLGGLGDFGNLLLNSAKQLGDGIKSKLNIDSDKSVGKNMANFSKALESNFHVGAAIKGAIKDMLGRPAQYAMQSLLTGDDVGLWHVTIGNPKNPIASIGNLILKKATVTHSGALGVDDFPSEIKVSVTLEHGRGRDAVDISRMYTKGLGGIYMLPKIGQLSDFYKTGTSGITTNDVVDSEADKEAEALQKYEYVEDKVDKQGKVIEKGYYKLKGTNGGKLDDKDIRKEWLDKQYEYANDNKNYLVDATAAKYEWFGQSYLSTFKRVLQEMA